MKISKNIKLIINESYRWRNRQLIEKSGFNEPELTLLGFIKSNIFLVLGGLLFAVFFETFFNSDFAGYAITALSIFIGLFTTVLILIFDKFINHSKRNDINDASAKILLDFKRTKNFSRKFIFVSLEGLLIAISIIIFFLIPLMLKESFVIDVKDYRFVWNDISLKSVFIFIINGIIIITRLFLVVFLFKFFKYLFLIFGFLGAYIKGVFDNNVNT